MLVSYRDAHACKIQFEKLEAAGCGRARVVGRLILADHTGSADSDRQAAPGSSPA